MKKGIAGLLDCIKVINKFGKSTLFLLLVVAVLDNCNIYLLNVLHMHSTNMLIEGVEFNVFILRILLIICSYIVLKSLAELIRPIITKNFIEIGMRVNFDLGKQYMKLPYYKTEIPQFIDKFDKALRAVNNRVGLNKAFESLQSIIVSLFSVIIWGCYVQKKVGNTCIYFVIMIGIFTLNEIIFRNKLYDNENQIIRSLREETYYTSIYTGYEYGKEIRANKLSELFSQKIGNSFDNLCKTWNTENKLSMINSVINGVTYILIYCLMLYHFLILAFNGDISVGEFIFYFGILSSFLMAIRTLISSLMDIYETGIYFSDYSEFNNIIKREVNEDLHKKRIKNINEITFINVSFKYVGSQEYVLKNVSFKINKNERVAVVGANGCGKTTIINLILGLYKPDEGEILINGFRLEEIGRENYIDLVSAIFQDDYLFAFPIWKNITMSNMKDMERLEKTIHETGIKNIFEKFSDKENTVLYKKLDEKGVELSGGEGKKLCCARAIYKKADLLVCDEVAASLDVDTEYQIYDMLHKHCKNRIIVFVSHKIKSTMFCDKIIFLNKGKVVEIGTPQELLNIRGTYYEMYKQESCLCE